MAGALLNFLYQREKQIGANLAMAGIPLFAQGGHQKLTPKKAVRAAQNPAQNPFFFATKPFFLFALKKNSFGAKKGQKRGVAHKKSKTEAGQIDMKTGEFPP